MSQEIERKFAVKYIPNNLKIDKIIDIKQNLVYRDKFTMIRLRKIINRNKKQEEYIYTVKNKISKEEKDGKVSNLVELEKNISKEDYEKIIKNKIYNTINKTRIVVHLEENLKAEIDIYYDYLEGLLTLEVEFPTRDTAKKFEIPDWFGEELGYSKISNGKLSKMSKEEFKEVVTEEFLEENRKLIKDLKEKYKI